MSHFAPTSRLLPEIQSGQRLQVAELRANTPTNLGLLGERFSLDLDPAVLGLLKFLERATVKHLA